jgi:ParB family chromosome partitioning protein
MEKKALGRGLGALFEGPPADVTPVRPLELEVNRISPNRFQPRKEFNEDGLKELADSVKRTGVLQPILVRKHADGRYELIAGERRWRAARAAGLATVPAVVKDATDDEVLALALIENIQRQDLNPIDTARGCQRLIKEFRMTQEEIAVRLGKNRSSVANALRLLSLPVELQEAVRDGRLSAGHAKALLGLSRAQEQSRAAREIMKRGLSVRQSEALVRRLQKPGAGKKVAPRLPDLVALEDRLRRYLSTSVRIAPGGKGGRMTIHYYDGSDLDRIAELILSPSK